MAEIDAPIRGARKALAAHTTDLLLAEYTTGGIASFLDVFRQLVRDMVRSRHLVWVLLKRDLASQYRHSLLGILPSLLPALTTTAWAILFRSANLINVGQTSVPYPFFVLCGMTMWAAFLEAIDAPVQGVQSEQGLLSKSSVPAEAVTFARLGQVFLNCFVRASAIVVAAVFYRIDVSWTAALAPVGVALLVAQGAAIGLIVAPFTLLYRDVARALPIVTTFWFFLTPIIFVLPSQGLVSIVMRINPVTPILVATRDLILPGSGISAAAAAGGTVFTVGIFVAGLVFHRIAMPIVIDRANV